MAKTTKAPAKKKAAKKAPAKKPAAAKKPTPVQSVPKGELIYSEVSVSIASGENAVTEEQAKQLLGWEEVADENYLFKDIEGKRIRCTNNSRNRPFAMSGAMLWAQEVLRKRWAGPNGTGNTINGEPMIIGQYGQTISAQHRLIGLVLACQMWRKDKDKYPEWTSEPVMDTLIVFGVSEEDDVVNTIDTGRPRSLADVIYRSEYFADISPKQREELARICQFSVRQVWERTGVKNAHGIDKTHAEFLDLINRHPKLLACVKHIYEEDGGDGVNGKRITKACGGAGYAAGLMLLMGCSASDPTEYRKSEQPNEDMLDWSLWDKAEEFWVYLGTGDKRMAAMREALGELLQTRGPDGQVVSGSRAEKLAIVIKAWEQFAQGKPITAESIKLKYSTEPNEDGVHRLIECPTVGGIDLGEARDAEDIEDDPTPQQVEQRKAAVKAAARAETNGAPLKKASVKKVAPRKATTADLTHTVWVVDPQNPEALWHGTLEKIEGDTATVKAGKGLASAGKPFDVPLSQVQTAPPPDVDAV